MTSQGPPSPEDSRTVVRLQRRRGEDGQAEVVEPEEYETVKGSKPGSRFLRLTRQGDRKLVRTGEGAFEATRAGSRPREGFGRILAGIRGIVLGAPVASSELGHQRLSKKMALAIFSSDALSSSAYATEEILLVLVLAGTAATVYSIPIAICIGLLASIVVVSYRQTIRAYPNGGGSYVVAQENLGPRAGLLAGSALLVSYVLTVAVSVAACVAATTSAIPELRPERLYLALAIVALLTVANLRGIRESASIFAIPTYFFIVTFGGMLATGLVRTLVLGHDLNPPLEDTVHLGTQGVTVFLLLRAFSAGSAALTGIEAVANGVPSFKPPESRNAATTQVYMAAILMAFVVSATYLAYEIGVIPSHSRTVVSQLASAILGDGPLFYVLQSATVMILILGANTAFAGLPNLTSVMAKDGVMPKQFTFRGDRLAFSNGIIFLGVASAILLVIFNADTHSIIPLYAFGVFTAFTLSQAGMVIYARRNRLPGWRKAQIINGIGAAVTAFVALVVLGTRFVEGAWLSIVVMVAIALVLQLIRNHYQDAALQLGVGMTTTEGTTERAYAAANRQQSVIIPVDRIDRAVLRTVAYARSISPGAVAVHVADDAVEAEELRRQWDRSVPDTPLHIVESPYRSLVEPLVAYIDGLERTRPGGIVTVVLPEFVPKHFWQKPLHNQLPVRLKKALINRPNTVVVDVPYHFTR